MRIERKWGGKMQGGRRSGVGEPGDLDRERRRGLGCANVVDYFLDDRGAQTQPWW